MHQIYALMSGVCLRRVGEYHKTFVAHNLHKVPSIPILLKDIHSNHLHINTLVLRVNTLRVKRVIQNTRFSFSTSFLKGSHPIYLSNNILVTWMVFFTVKGSIKIALFTVFFILV